MTTTAIEVEEVLAAAQAALEADPILAASPLDGRIYQNLAPKAASYPLIVLDGVTAPDWLTANGEHVSQDVTFQVTVRDKGGTSKARIQPLAAAVYDCLTAIDGYTTPSGVYLARIRRLRVIPRGPDVVNDVVYPSIVQEFFTEADPA